MHLEPAPDIDENIVSLVEKGVIRVGQIQVYSGFVALGEDTSNPERVEP
jgi:hypothetical protein